MLAERGAAQIVLADIDEGALEETGSVVRSAGAEVTLVTADLSGPEEAVRLVREADATVGGLDIVHNNAGIMAGEPFFPDTPVEKMVAVIQINLIAMMVGTHEAIARLRARNAPGVIVNTASTAAFGPMPADPAYSASKAGILNFTQSCAPLHEAFGIRVMAVCPGMTDTAIVPKDAEWLQPALQRLKLIQPEEIAAAVCEAIEDDSRAGDYLMVENEPLEGGT
jgi:NAD(P)-dependent dehydrogenase (short-subunit alcohol dehydrogenase family)